MINYFLALNNINNECSAISTSLFVRYYIRSRFVVRKAGISIDRISLRLESGYICMYIHDLVFKRTRMAPLKYRLRGQDDSNFIYDLVQNRGVDELYCSFRYSPSIFNI